MLMSHARVQPFYTEGRTEHMHSMFVNLFDLRMSAWTKLLHQPCACAAHAVTTSTEVHHHCSLHAIQHH